MIYVDDLSESEIFAEFEEYGLQCIYPSNKKQSEVIKALKDGHCSANEFVKNKCFEFVNYALMDDILDYLIPRYVANKKENEQIFDFVDSMVRNEEYFDLDNNVKYVT